MILARSTPSPPSIWGIKSPPPFSSSCVNARVRWLWMAVKITFSLVLSKLVLNDVKVEVLLISRHFVVVLWMRPLPTHLLTLSCFGILKVLRRYICGPSFISVWFVVLEFLNLKCFHNSRKYNFRAASGRFFGRNPLKCCQICLEFWTVMQCIVMHQAYAGFHFILKKHLKLSEKIDFMAHFERFLVSAFSHPMSYTSIFRQIKRLMEVHNRGKFY